MKSGTCPKCGSPDVRVGKEKRHFRNALLVTRRIARLDNYVCPVCGYVESYLADPSDKGSLIKSKWPG